MILTEEREKKVQELRQLKNELKTGGILTQVIAMDINSAIARIIQDQIAEVLEGQSNLEDDNDQH